MLGILSLVALNACATGNKNDWKQFNLDKTKTVEGVDKDGNGVRDDIDGYIHHYFKKDIEIKAVTQHARSLQASLLVDLNNKNAVYGAIDSNMRSMSCVANTFNDFNGNVPTRYWNTITDELFSLTTNTRKRKKAYKALSNAADGGSFGIPTYNVCDK